MLTAERVRELLLFDAQTGTFSQAIVYAGRGARWKSGRVAGSVSKQSGYLTLRLDGKLYQAHRVAWLHVTGSWPTQQIDHRDGDRLNNRFANLRDVSNAINRQNTKAARRESKTGVQGVQIDRRTGRPYAKLELAGKSTFLGSFDTVAYVAAKRELHPGWEPPPCH